jgi:predicted phage terminase large subunit-like protein
MNNDYLPLIQECYKAITGFMKNKEWNNDEKITRLLSLYQNAIFQQIHTVLVPMKTDKTEKQIRDILSKYVIGCTKNRVTYIGVINPIKAKLQQLSKKKATTSEFLARYLELYDDFMALASFRSYKHYCIYMQQVFGDDFTLWSDTQNCFDGYWYYANKMVLDGEVKFLEKQLPTGYGKSLSDAFQQSWTFGIDIDNDIFKVCGNDKFTDDCLNNVTKLMLAPQFAKIFPYFEQFNGEKSKMFQYWMSGDEKKFLITGSTKSTNFRIITKLSDCNGVRAKFLYLDDITQRKDMANIAMHTKDIHAFTHEWFERNYNRNKLFIIASGTTYSTFDILSHLKRKMGGENAQRTKINKYTYIGVSDYIVPNGVSVFVCVPLLDYDTDESTYPKKISTFSARKKREDSPVEFWAMDMQQPLPPEDAPFYYEKLREYTTLPKIGEMNRLPTCVCAIDTKRRGKDYLSMPIFFEANDSENEGQTAFYLVDWLYTDKPMTECIPLIVNKIIQHKITRVIAERNTEECIAMLIIDKLKERGYTSCVVDEIYSTERKDRRIMMAEGDIKSRLILPQYGMYSAGNEIGKALLNVYGYTYTGTIAHDDAPDSLALFAKHFVMGFGIQYATMSSFSR